MVFVSRLLAVAVLAAGLGSTAVAAQTGTCDQTQLGVAACPPAVVPLAPDSLEGRLEALLLAAPSARLSQGDKDDIAGASAFYAARRFTPVWVNGRGLTPSAIAAINEVRRAADWGIDAPEFTLAGLDPAAIGQRASDTQSLASAELTLTRAILKYGRFARGGRIPDPSGELSSYIDRKPTLIAPATLLGQISSAPDAAAYLIALHPRHPQFERLRQAYLKARAGQNRLAAMRLPPGPALMPGRSHPDVAILRKRLAVPALAPSPGVASLDLFYDPVLVAAVEAFQETAGLKRADGIVGDKTRAALNGETGGQIPTLLANMEQWRWMPETLGDTHVMVNIPEYQMRLVKNGAVVHSERVITGKPDTATPVFSEMMQTVVFQPKWGVPESIKINELLPRLQRGGGLRSGLRMSLNGREVDPWSVDWSRADIRRYHIYQPSGDDNALGQVKFLFPNKHAVYMHDTPTKSLFNAETRTYSHGCIRVRNPVRLAELVLGADKGWNGEIVRDLTEDGPADNAIRLDTKIPVHITYFTAAVDDAGKLTTFNDVYGHEKRVTLSLEGRGDKITKLEPAPLGGGALSAIPGENAPQAARRIRDGRYDAPVALGFTVPKPPAFTLFAPSSTPAKSSGGRRFQGNTPNDILMRQLNGN